MLPLLSYAVHLLSFSCAGTSEAAKFLRANGVTLFKVREETVNLLGKSDMYFFSPEHPPLTEPAQRALDWAIDEKLKSGKFPNSCSQLDLLVHGIVNFPCQFGSRSRTLQIYTPLESIGVYVSIGLLEIQDSCAVMVFRLLVNCMLPSSFISLF